jgi:cystathionine beta-lyase
MWLCTPPTKYLAGHSDVIAGALITKSARLGKQLHFQQFATGATLGPIVVVLRDQNAAFTYARHHENGESCCLFEHIQSKQSIFRI